MNLQIVDEERIMNQKNSYLKYEEVYENKMLLEKTSPEYYKTTYPAKMESACKPYKVFARTIFSNILNLTLHLDVRAVIFIYPVERFENLCDILSEKYNIFTFSNVFRKTPICSKYTNIKVLSNSLIQKSIYKSYKTHEMCYVENGLNQLIKILNGNHVRMIILGDDWTFFERLSAIAGQRMDVPVITLQHGIYHKKTIDLHQFGKYSSQFWCWSEYVKKYYEKRYGTKEGFLKVVGYPHKIPEDYEFTNSKRVLFLSTPYTEDDRSKCAEYEAMIESIVLICNKLDVKFSFRLHPREKREYYKKRFSNLQGFSISDETNLSNDVKSSGIVIGDTSSSLLEANLLHRYAIQVIWNDKIKKWADDELFNSMIKAKIEGVEDAIKTYIGRINFEKDIFFVTGNPEVFETNILENVKEALMR